MSGSQASSVFASLFADDMVVVESEVQLVDDLLFPEERACVRNAVAKRRAEFGTGRVCARRALAQLGLPAGPLVVGAGGAPVWPKGTVGSITHTASVCAVVVARCPPWRSVGIDAEDVTRMDDEIVKAISTDDERGSLMRLPHGDREAEAMLLFSAKEAYYKLQYPLTGRFLDFHDAQVEVDRAANRFSVRASVDMPRELADVRGRFAFVPGRVLCGLELRG